MHPDVTSTQTRKKCPQVRHETSITKQPSAAAAKPTAGYRESRGRAEQSTSLSSMKIPDAQVLDQHGKQLNFYSDLVKGKTVAINFIFTTCTAICPSLTATFRRVQQDAANAASKCN